MSLLDVRPRIRQVTQHPRPRHFRIPDLKPRFTALWTRLWVSGLRT
jgi:hypothetical protein